MENSGQQDRVQMTLKSYQLLSENFPEFRCSPRGGVRIEGIGTLLTYWLDGCDSDGVTSDRSASDVPTQRRPPEEMPPSLLPG
uniref:Guanylate cyclase domain-containing protein n=1 Tax=Globodera rostochiensis TaxID=31243 RepID=A0A914GU57_GLORO